MGFMYDGVLGAAASAEVSRGVSAATGETGRGGLLPPGRPLSRVRLAICLACLAFFSFSRSTSRCSHTLEPVVVPITFMLSF